LIAGKLLTQLIQWHRQTGGLSSLLRHPDLDGFGIAQVCSSEHWLRSKEVV